MDYYPHTFKIKQLTWFLQRIERSWRMIVDCHKYSQVAIPNAIVLDIFFFFTVIFWSKSMRGPDTWNVLIKLLNSFFSLLFLLIKTNRSHFLRLEQDSFQSIPGVYKFFIPVLRPLSQRSFCSFYHSGLLYGSWYAMISFVRSNDIYSGDNMPPHYMGYHADKT